MYKACEDTNIEAKLIATFVRAKSTYTCQPSMKYFRIVRVEAENLLSSSRDVDMAALDAYNELLNSNEYKVQFVTLSRAKKKETRLKAARFIFK